MWKAFRIWRRGVRSDKVAAAKAALQQQLFMLQPGCQQALLAARQLCLGVEELQLHAFEAGQLLTLPEYAERQAARQQACVQALSDFNERLEGQAQAACEHALHRLEQQLDLLTQEDLSPGASRTRRASLVNVGKTGQAGAGSRAFSAGAKPAGPVLDFTYAKLAARRSERRRLFNLVKLLDLQMCDSLHALLMGASGRTLRLLQEASSSAGSESATAGAPLFSLQLHLQQEEGCGCELALVPATSQYLGAVVAGVRDSTDLVCAVPLLSKSEKLQVSWMQADSSSSSCCCRRMMSWLW